MPALLWSAAFASVPEAPPAPPGGALLRCSLRADEWRCGDTTLRESPRHRWKDTVARLTLGDGTAVELVALDVEGIGARWTAGDAQRTLEAVGPRGAAERAALEWIRRGGPGGGRVEVAGFAVELPVGCGIDDQLVTCRDGSALGFVEDRFWSQDADVGEVDCRVQGVARRCAVRGLRNGGGLVVAAGPSLRCFPTAQGARDACGGTLDFDAAALGSVVARPATARCHLVVGDPPGWDCGGARVVVAPSERLRMPDELPPTRGPQGWVMATGGRVRMCNGPDLLCEPLLTDWEADPPGTRSATFTGRSVAIPAACDVATAGDRLVVGCDDGTVYVPETGACVGSGCGRFPSAKPGRTP